MMSCIGKRWWLAIRQTDTRLVHLSPSTVFLLLKKHVYSFLLGFQTQQHARFREGCFFLDGRHCSEEAGAHYTPSYSWAKQIDTEAPTTRRSQQLRRYIRIVRYENGIGAALRHFKTKEGLELKESMVLRCKQAFLQLGGVQTSL